MADASSQLTDLRADARHNRERLLDAARELFAERGLDVPMAAVARRAGVGMATLYRRFPTRAALVTEVFTDQLTDCASVVDEALADPDAWRGFRTVVENVCAMHTQDRGFTMAFLSEFPDAYDFTREQERAERGLTALADRAQRAGALRADFHPSDLVLVLMANSGLAAPSQEAKEIASRRLVALLLRSFAATPEAADAPLPPPASVALHDLPGLGSMPELTAAGTTVSGRR
ncbi:TetR/AcrR family transcriptional regulator [Streptomyces triticagri]|uniref:TetR/AcrR family transcriptional regulator n=1 Tax=Streptomyces triticagri TaxID=2293568 RepID=A0A372LYL3_9ACTN|nr:TetR/AcrR family transcriptional regulator [Streptomyces triticagri]RFU83450.1 TetR/AcrR family transcriptional regulator [Streptomyces triticagri]